MNWDVLGGKMLFFGEKLFLKSIFAVVVGNSEKKLKVRFYNQASSSIFTFISPTQVSALIFSELFFLPTDFWQIVRSLYLGRQKPCHES